MEIHLVALAVPYPPNYGGGIDIFYKIKALQQAGAQIRLHCFAYGKREMQPILEDYCLSVHYYKRTKMGLLRHWQLPYIVSSRASKALLERIAAQPAPVLLEGLHTAAFLGHPDWANNPQWLRMHNIEWQYYGALAQQEPGFLKRLYYNWESKRLKGFEQQLQKAKGILAISPPEYEYLQTHYPQTFYLPVFHENTAVSGLDGRGDYLLYQGNLSVNENERAVNWILHELARKTDYPIVIAGQSPSWDLQKRLKPYPNIRLVANPSDSEMKELIAHAQVHLLPTFQATGIKLKLLNALYQGRFCLANTAMVDGTGLESLCWVQDEATEWLRLISELMQRDFTDADRTKRINVLSQYFDNQRNAEQLLEWMGGA